MQALDGSEALASKMRIFFVPYLVISISLAIAYSFLNWWFLIKHQSFLIQQHLVIYAGPAIITALFAFLYFVPRLKYLKLKVGKIEFHNLYYFCVWLAMALPIISAQVYLNKNTGRLTQLNDVSEISRVDYTKFYTLKQYYLHKKGIGVYLSDNVTGKRKRDYNMYIHVVFPILTREKDTLSFNAAAWLGKSFKKTIRNRLSREEKALAFKVFYTKTMMAIKQEPMDKFNYLKRPAYSLNSDRYSNALVKSPYYHFKNQLILEAQNTPFENRSDTSYRFMIGSFLIGSFIWLLMILIPGLKQEQDQLSISVSEL